MASETNGSKVVERALTDCILEKVMVYTDRAEISRQITLKVEPNETYEIRLQNLPHSADEDSVRVEGKGVATISEVIVQRRSVPIDDSSATEKVKNLRKELETLKEANEKLKEKTRRVTEKRDFVKRFGDNFSSIGTNKEPTSKSSLTDGMSALKDYLTFYEASIEEFDQSTRSLKKQQSTMQEKINSIEKELREIDQRSNRSRDIVVLLDTPKEAVRGEVELGVRYLVDRAGWQPKYDVRVNGNEMKMQIQYFGLIRQSTGEDWHDVRLFLSTAQPSLGGTVPDLSTEKVSFRPKLKPVNQAMFRGAKKAAKTFAVQAQQNTLSNCEFFDQVMVESCDEEAPMAYGVTAVEDSVMHAAFSIDKNTTIPSDNQEHRVTIGIIALDAEMEYHCVPKLDAHAYMTAKVTNKSEYPMLAGPSSIFLDNNFVCKSRMQAVSANEEFSCSLGVDPAVRVTYKPVHKFKSEKGMWTKSNSVTYSQVTEVHNSRSKPVRLVLTDHLPQSDDDKIKVTLVNPAIASGQEFSKDGTAKINDKHNVEYNVSMKANSKRDFEVKYQVDFPAGEELKFSSSG